MKKKNVDKKKVWFIDPKLPGIVRINNDRSTGILVGLKENANLVAAAPEMLEALKQVAPMAKSLMDELGNRKAVDWGLVNDCLIAVQRAVAKAEGRS